jgi:hypothetical protein
MIRHLKRVPLVGVVGFLAACSVCLLPAAGALLAGGAFLASVGGVAGSTAALWVGIGLVAVGGAAVTFLTLQRRRRSC